MAEHLDRAQATSWTTSSQICELVPPELPTRDLSEGDRARLLNGVTPAFDGINFYGSRFAARIYNRTRMADKLDRVINSLQRSLSRALEDAFKRGMHYPNDWDPYAQPILEILDLVEHRVVAVAQQDHRGRGAVMHRHQVLSSTWAGFMPC